MTASCLLISLSLSDDEVPREVLLPDIPGIFLNPAIDPYFLDSTEIEQLHVVRVFVSPVGQRRQKGTRKIGTITAELYLLLPGTVESRTAFG